LNKSKYLSANIDKSIPYELRLASGKNKKKNPTPASITNNKQEQNIVSTKEDLFNKNNNTNSSIAFNNNQ